MSECASACVRSYVRVDLSATVRLGAARESGEEQDDDDDDDIIT